MDSHGFPRVTRKILSVFLPVTFQSPSIFRMANVRTSPMILCLLFRTYLENPFPKRNCLRQKYQKCLFQRKFHLQGIDLDRSNCLKAPQFRQSCKSNWLHNSAFVRRKLFTGDINRFYLWLNQSQLNVYVPNF